MRIDRILALVLAASPAGLLAVQSGCAGTVSGGLYTPDTSEAVVVDESPPAPRETIVYHRPGYVWITGRWVHGDGGWRWRRGYWVRERPNYVFVQGYWGSDRGRHVWHPGHWSERRHGYTWVEGRWTHRDGRAVWRGGYWSRPVVEPRARVRVYRSAPSAAVPVPSDREWRRRQGVSEREFDRRQDARERAFERRVDRSDMSPAKERQARREFDRQQDRREKRFGAEQNRKERRHNASKRREAAVEERRD
ncbi:MAG TPA: hypothetical protein VKB80_30650 [Kofleriaceae bacterium]|nr:hypothetical protein [Kofleriaceae bacterium]